MGPVTVRHAPLGLLRCLSYLYVPWLYKGSGCPNMNQDNSFNVSSETVTTGKHRKARKQDGK